MDREQLLDAVRRELTESRFAHTIRVAETAGILAKRFGADEEKVDIAAILHDYSKCWPQETLYEWIVTHKLRDDLLQHAVPLWHAFVGAEAVRERLGIADEVILNAIRYHTSGRPHMTLEEKVVWLADYIEPGREFPGVRDVRELAEYDLNGALLRGLDNTIMKLIERGQAVYPLTIEARNDVLHAAKPND